MTWKSDYCTVAELKTQLRITDTNDDVALAIAVTAASRAVDHACNRQFGLTGSAVQRIYTYEGVQINCRQALEIDDLMTVTGLVVAVDSDNTGSFDQAVTITTEFDLWPYNAAANGTPWTHIVLNGYTASTVYGFPWANRGVSVTANFGWSAVPTIVKQATLIQAARIFKRRDAAFGISGSPQAQGELRLLERMDPDVAIMLKSVRRPWGAV